MTSAGRSFRPPPLLSEVQTETISQLLPDSWSIKSPTAAWAGAAQQAYEAISWSTRLPTFTVDVLPSPNVIDALSQSLTAQNDVWHNQLTQVITSQHSLAALAARSDLSPSFASLNDTLFRYGSIQDTVGLLLADVGRTTELLRGYSAPPAARYDVLLGRLPGRPSPRRLAVACHGGNVQNGLLAVESLTAPNLDEEEARDFLNAVEEELIEPWRDGPVLLRENLLRRLGALDPEIAELLKGGWDNVSRPGPAAASQIAHCAVEVVSRTLRALGPDKEVRTWVSDHHPTDTTLLTTGGGPTRPARIRCALRDRPARDRKLVESQINALTNLARDTAGALQPVKHQTPVSLPVASASPTASPRASTPTTTPSWPW